MIELAREYGGYGYRRVAVLLRDAGWRVSVGRVERLWKREGLKVPSKQPKKGRLTSPSAWRSRWRGQFVTSGAATLRFPRDGINGYLEYRLDAWQPRLAMHGAEETLMPNAAIVNEDVAPMIAVVPIQSDGRIDALLNWLCHSLQARGLRVAGALRNTPPAAAPGVCDAVLRVLPDGPEIAITQNLGTGSASCRLDAGAMEAVAGHALARLEQGGADIVLLNKFGISEAEGRGFRSLIGKAVGRGIPVMIGVSDTHRDAFFAFCEDMAVEVPASRQSALEWCLRAAGKAHDVSAGSSRAL